MNMATHNQLGQQGETIALEYLENKGYKIKAINWRFKHQEIDIIAEKDSMLIIAEVKTRSNIAHQQPWEAVTKQKQRFLINAAEQYILQENIELETRFDIISVVIKDSQHHIEHIKAAFYPTIS